MRKVYISIICVILFFQNSFAITLPEALLQAYKNNPELNAERENIEVSKEDLNISKSEYLPSVTLSGSKSRENTDKLTNQAGVDQSINDANPLTQSIKIEQTLIDFGRKADLQKNKIGINLAIAKLKKKEQEILLKAIEAYSGLMLANEKFKISQNNLNLLERQVETDQARLERGQITLVDLAQSEASFAGAQAKYIEFRNEITTKKLNYENIIGPIDNINLLETKSNTNIILPENLEKAIEISKKNNPDLIIAKLEYNQSEKDFIIARSELSPLAKLSFENSRSEDFSSSYDERNKNTLKATITWPIYSGGKNIASVNKNKKLKKRKKLLLDSAFKTNDTNVASVWSILQSSKSLLNSVKSQVKAAEIANEGITVEYESGLGRSTLDVIQSNSILLNSKITLANSERNYLLSQFRLLQSVGLLTSDYLKLK
ncbi:TolC family protein [Candidatus Pelagibacter sp.]|nr:TolC family protein [Candidatus Pelagibacter sp.]